MVTLLFMSFRQYTQKQSIRMMTGRNCWTNQGVFICLFVCENRMFLDDCISRRTTTKALVRNQPAREQNQSPELKVDREMTTQQDSASEKGREFPPSDLTETREQRRVRLRSIYLADSCLCMILIGVSLISPGLYLYMKQVWRL